MPRPKNDADKLKQNRDERRDLIEGLADAAPDEFDELSEVTVPDIKLTLVTPPQAQPELPPPRQPSPSQSALETVSGTVDKLPAHHRLWFLLALVLAALAAYLVNQGIGR